MSSRQVDAQLRTACLRGDLAEVKLLLSKGADVNSTDDVGWSALHYAAHHGHTEVVKTLIQAGANLNVQPKIDGRTPLHFAAIAPARLDAAIELINFGADVTLKDSKRRTPFDMPNGRTVREYYESRLSAKAISEVFASGPADDGVTASKRGLSL